MTSGKLTTRKRLVGWSLVLLGILIVAVGLTHQRSIRIAYHRRAMMTAWSQFNAPSPEPSWITSILEKFGLGSSKPNPLLPRSFSQLAVLRVIYHRDALVRLDQLIPQHFQTVPTDVSGNGFENLMHQVSHANASWPGIQFDFDKTNSPPRIIGLTIFSTREDASRAKESVLGWTNFIKNSEPMIR